MNNKPILLPLGIISEALEIDKTGKTGLKWKTRPLHHFKSERQWRKWNDRYAGTPAGSLVTNQHGYNYQSLKIYKRPYKCHRIVYLLAHNVDPGHFTVDHIDGNGLNNDPVNLRLATQQNNTWNRKISSKSASGCAGVLWDKSRQKWKAAIFLNNKSAYLGSFTHLGDAIRARREAEEKHYGAFSYKESQKLANKSIDDSSAAA